MASPSPGTSQHGVNKCAMCENSDNPLVPSFIPGEVEMCSRCVHVTQIEKLDEVRQLHNELETIQQEGDTVSGMLEGEAPDRETRELEKVREKVRQKARGAMELMMGLHVPKQTSSSSGKEEVGKFEPTFGDIQVIEALAPDVCLQLRKGSLRQFHSILHPVNNMVDGEMGFKGTLFEVFGSEKKTNKKEYTDKNTRAKKLVEATKKIGSKKVYLLDGHGRMLLSIVHAMIEQGLDPDSYEFVVVDNDEACHRFHEHLFPKSVTCRCMNILDIELEETDMLYMNFCSIPSRVENILFNKEEVLKWAWQCMKTHVECGIMISAMIRDTRTKAQIDKGTLTAVGPRKGKHTKEFHLLPAGFRECLEDLFGAKVVSRRHNFWTWLIVPEKCATKNEPDCLQSWFKDEGIEWDRNVEFYPGALVKCEKSSGRIYRIVNRTPDRVDLVEYDPVLGVHGLEEVRRDIKNVSIALETDMKDFLTMGCTDQEIFEIDSQ